MSILPLSRFRNLNKNVNYFIFLLIISAFLSACGSSSGSSSGGSDVTAPLVNSVSPLNTATSVAITTTVQGIFNENLDCTSVTSSTFTLVNSSAAPVAGSIMCSNATATFTPNAGLLLDSFTATLTIGITDLAGNPLASNYQWGFATTSPWTQQWGTTGADVGMGITADSADNVYVAGGTTGALDGQTSAGGSDLFVTKYNASGVKQWTRQLGTSTDDVGRSIAHDSTNNIYVAGDTTGALDGQATAGSLDLYVTKYNASGVKQWTRQLGTTGFDVANGVITDSADNVYVAGYTTGALDGQTLVGLNDLFVTKYNASGVKQWTRQLGTTNSDSANGVITDTANNVYVAGFTRGALDGQTAAGGDDLFVTKYNTSGVKQWTRQLGTTGSDQATGITTDSADNIYVTGYTSGALDGQTLVGLNDLFVTKYNASGVKQWTRQLGTTGFDRANGITTDSADNVYVTGWTAGALDGQASAGGGDLFVTKYSASGVKQWTRQLGTTGDDTAYGITRDSANNVYVTGYTGGALDGQTSAGGSDIFAVKYASDGTKQ